MKNSKQFNKAENILADESLFEKLKSGESAEALSQNKKEALFAKKMYKAIKNNSTKLSDNEKSLLKRSIKASVKTYRARRILFSVSAVAAVVIALVLTSVLYMQDFTPSGIGEYAENAGRVPISGNTLLILQDAKEVQIDTKESRIEYLNEGGKIKIDTDKEIDQVVDEKEVAYNTIIVPYGKRTQVTLSDNSKIWLNSGSKLVFPATFSSSRREVFLEGEALFEIAHNANQPFYVLVRDIEIKVLGTVFNVSAYNDDKYTSTVLENGSIELKYKSNALLRHSRLQITPGTLAIYDPVKKVIQQQKVDTKYYTSWREGIFIFESEPLENITKKLSRYYNVKITIKDRQLSKETFSGSLDLKNSAMQVLQVIGETSDFKLTEVEGEIIIN